MFRFEYPDILFFLLAVPLGLIFFLLKQYRDKKRLNLSIDKKLQSEVLPLLSYGKQRLKFFLVCLAYIFIVLAASNPQVASGVDKRVRKGCDVIICLDVSNSMLAEDLSPNRLERAKLAISQLISGMQDDRIGIVLFAGSSYTFLPLTSDYATARMFNDIIDTKLIENQGTDIQQALETASRSFGESKGKDRSRTIILISDGEDNQPAAEDISKSIAKKGIIINAIGIGNEQGVRIPIRDRSGNVDFKKDRDGNIVITKLNEQTLKKISSQGGGTYVRANNMSLGLNEIMKSINKMDKQEYSSLAYRDYNTIFYIFAMAGLIVLIIEFFIFSAKHRIVNRKFFFGKD
ncbi:MAG: VWA domain-containing protein [Bacteroidales bacterium]|nr:VWA domain-containing protein [Bacteroidales bacterium]